MAAAKKASTVLSITELDLGMTDAEKATLSAYQSARKASDLAVEATATSAASVMPIFSKYRRTASMVQPGLAAFTYEDMQVTWADKFSDVKKTDSKDVLDRIKAILVTVDENGKEDLSLYNKLKTYVVPSIIRKIKSDYVDAREQKKSFKEVEAMIDELVATTASGKDILALIIGELFDLEEKLTFDKGFDGFLLTALTEEQHTQVLTVLKQNAATIKIIA